MGVFLRAVVNGFGFSLGTAIYKRVADRLGLNDKECETKDPDGAGDDEADESLGDEEDGDS